MPDCTHGLPPDNIRWLQVFNHKVYQNHIPLCGGIDLTHRCNLKCVHCYLGPHDDGQDSETRSELTAEQWIDVIDQIVVAGCLFLLITGGEPLLRKDFGLIYRYAKKKGLVITVFTNGTMITEDILALFSELPPHLVEISLYGASAEIYEKITGVKGSYRKCIEGIERLLAQNIHLNIKTILMTLNREEFFEIENIAKRFGVRFRYDPAIFPCINGDDHPLKLRIPANDAVAIEMADNFRRKEWGKFFHKSKKISIPETLYICAAGVFQFHINPYGDLLPCLMSTDALFNLNSGFFSEGWQAISAHIQKCNGARDRHCAGCEKISLCGYCPAFFKLETGSEQVRSGYLCDLAHYRYNVLS